MDIPPHVRDALMDIPLLTDPFVAKRSVWETTKTHTYELLIATPNGVASFQNVYIGPKRNQRTMYAGHTTWDTDYPSTWESFLHCKYNVSTERALEKWKGVYEHWSAQSLSGLLNNDSPFRLVESTLTNIRSSSDITVISAYDFLMRDGQVTIRSPTPILPPFPTKSVQEIFQERILEDEMYGMF